MFCCHKRSFDWKEKVLSLIFLEILEKIAGTTKISPQKMNHDLLENTHNFFSNFAYKLCRLSSSNSSSFVIKCLTSFRDIRHYLGWGVFHYRCYGDSCCLETNEEISFGQMLKRWGSIKEIEVYLLCEILISKDTLQGQKNCCEPP